MYKTGRHTPLLFGKLELCTRRNEKVFDVINVRRFEWHVLIDNISNNFNSAIVV